MSQRWFKYQGQQFFIGWDRSLQRHYLTVLDLCKYCLGTGEDRGPGEVCSGCGGEGFPPGFEQRVDRSPASTIDEIAADLARRDVPFPAYMRADLEADQHANDVEVVHDYDLDPRRVSSSSEA